MAPLESSDESSSVGDCSTNAGVVPTETGDDVVSSGERRLRDPRTGLTEPSYVWSGGTRRTGPNAHVRRSATKESKAKAVVPNSCAKRCANTLALFYNESRVAECVSLIKEDNWVSPTSVVRPERSAVVILNRNAVRKDRTRIAFDRNTGSHWNNSLASRYSVDLSDIVTLYSGTRAEVSCYSTCDEGFSASSESSDDSVVSCDASADGCVVSAEAGDDRPSDACWRNDDTGSAERCSTDIEQSDADETFLNSQVLSTCGKETCEAPVTKAVFWT